MSVFLDPDKAIGEMGLKDDMVAAEFGSGPGGFAIPLAKKLEHGLVYALDIQQEPLSVLKSRSQIENITNIKIIRCDIEKGSTLAEESVDVVLLSNILFQVDDKTAMISEAVRVLKDKGKLVVIDWLPDAYQGPTEGRVSAEEIKKLTKGSNLQLEKEFEAGTYHFGLIFTKS